MIDLSSYVPHIWKSELDAEASAFLIKFYPEALKMPMCVPIEHIVKNVMHLKVVEHYLSEDLSILGQMCFTDGMAEIYDPVNDEYREIFVKTGTMIIDPDTYAKRNLGSKRNTMAHDGYHWFRHRGYYLMAAQCDNEVKRVYRCPTVAKSESIQTEWTDEDWIEWQANNVAPRILMPKETVCAVYEKMIKESQKNPFIAKGLRPQSEWIIEQTAGFYMVSKQAAYIRLKELGYFS